MLKISVKETEVKGIREAVRELKKLEDDSVKILRRELKRVGDPYLKGIRAFVKGAEQRLKTPGANTPEGMNIFHNGRTGFTQPSVLFSFTPSKYKGSVISITATGRNKQFGFDILEKAGTHALTGKGLAMTEAANRRLGTNKPGRMAYRAIVRQLPEIRKDMAFILENYTDYISETRLAK